MRVASRFGGPARANGRASRWAKSATVGLRARGDEALKLLAQGADRTETCRGGDAFHRVARGLEQGLGSPHSCVQQTAQRRSAQLLAKAPIQCANAERRAPRNDLQRERFGQVLL